LQSAHKPKLKSPELKEPFRTRPVHFLELWETGPWKIKLYGLAYQRQRPRPELVEAAKRVAQEALPASPEEANAYGVGFMGVHDGRDFNFVFVDWWADENELHHHVFESPTEQPAELEEITHTGVASCVFDLQLIWFERNAWVEKVLANAQGPNIEAYLKKRLEDQA